MPDDDRLAIPRNQLLSLGRAALDRIAAYYDTLSARPVFIPSTSQALRALLNEPLPQDGALRRRRRRARAHRASR